jgi:dTDP-4-amino-4,6-dideoxygalactose transaminase
MHDVKESSPWRFSFMVPKERRAALIASLRAKGIDASSWYPAIHRWFSKEKSPAGCPNADVVAQQVVNLWVDKKDPNYAERVAAMVVENLARPEEGPSG